MRDVVEQDGTGAAFRAIASQLRSRESELVSQRPGQCLMLHDIDSATLSVDVEANKPLAGTADPVDSRTAASMPDKPLRSKSASRTLGSCAGNPPFFKIYMLW